MKKPVMAAILSGLLLGGCGDTGGDTSEGNSQPRVKLKNKHHEELVALPDNLRRIGLMRAIRTTGNRCPFRVESARHQGEYRDLSVWTARCDDNRQWAIFVSASGHVQVRNCEDVAELELPRCAELPPAPPQAPRKVRRPGVTTER